LRLYAESLITGESLFKVLGGVWEGYYYFTAYIHIRGTRITIRVIPIASDPSFEMYKSGASWEDK